MLSIPSSTNSFIFVFEDKTRRVIIDTVTNIPNAIPTSLPNGFITNSELSKIPPNKEKLLPPIVKEQ